MPDDHIGTREDWEKAENALAEAITSIGKEYIVNPGDGAFYGPKLDFHIEDSLGRTWQCGTIQLDYQLPGRFDLEYIGADGEGHTPVMIHRVVFGSIERFIGVITEHFAGAFPTWLSPVQVKVMSITDRSAEYAKSVAEKLAAFRTLRAVCGNCPEAALHARHRRQGSRKRHRLRARPHRQDRLRRSHGRVHREHLRRNTQPQNVIYISSLFAKLKKE